MRWRRTLLWLHRDVGYFCVGLIVLYAVSGVAVNHRHHWDYNFSIDRQTLEIGPPEALLGPSAASFDAATRADPGALARAGQDALVTAIAARVAQGEKPRKVFWRAADRLSLFFGPGDGHVVDYLPASGKVEASRKQDRLLIRAFNRLHLNEKHGAWTWLADAFAVAMLFLAFSGALILRGRKGILGRGGVLALLGVVVPILGLFWLG